MPIVLSTDDQGVLRTDMTEQFVRAVLEHQLGYSDLKSAARNSIEFSFLPGSSIWDDGVVGRHTAECRNPETPDCRALALHSPKAALQFRLEDDFAAFEEDILSWELAPLD